MASDGPTKASSKALTIADVGEFGLIDLIRNIVVLSKLEGPSHPSVPYPPRQTSLVLGIGDDAAAFRPTPGLLTLATCDMLVEGRHFLLNRSTPYQLGRRSAAVNLSDIGAMGGQPRQALVSLALPKTTEVAWVEELYRGLQEELQRHHALVIGGNLSATSGPLCIDITLLGEVGEQDMVRRSGGRAGDVILVTGTLGSSAAGLLALEAKLSKHLPGVMNAVQAHLVPTPRVGEGRAIGESRLATAMIDLSDGLAGDLAHICGASGVGARITAASLPIAAGTRALAASLTADPLALALHGGEDYELLFTCPPSATERLRASIAAQTETAVTEIGVLTETPEIVLETPDGRLAPLVKGGWDHFAVRS